MLTEKVKTDKFLWYQRSHLWLNKCTVLTVTDHIYFHNFIMKKFRCTECFHMMSWWPYWCPTTIKRWPCWCPKPILWELNSFLMQTLSFVPINLHRCWPCEWKHSICSTYDFDPEAKTIILSCTFSPLCQLFGFFRKRISHVLQLLVEFVHFIFAYATFSRFPSGAFQGLLRQKRGTLFECHYI